MNTLNAGNNKEIYIRSVDQNIPQFCHVGGTNPRTSTDKLQRRFARLHPGEGLRGSHGAQDGTRVDAPELRVPIHPSRYSSSQGSGVPEHW